MDVLLLSRIQFAFTVGFHYLFPPLSIGLGLLMVLAEGLYLLTGDKQYETIARFWTSLFAVIFALGVASGIVMEFEFGTNWASYSRFVGDVFGAPLAAEGIFAFFLESSFLGLLVFGWDRVGKKTHFFATCMVFFGAVLSSVWIVVANSWQQTPAGFRIEGEGAQARAVIEDFWAMVFNPSTVDRLLHVWMGAFVAGAFLILSISAFYLFRNRHQALSQKMFRMSLVVATIMALGSLGTGHLSAHLLTRTQPAKLAAFEGEYRTPEGGSPLYLLGFPDDDTEEVRLGLPIPGLLSFLVYGNFKDPVPGLDRIPREDWPPVFLTFEAYHAMVGLGFFFIGITVLGCLLLWRGAVYRQRWLLSLYVLCAPLSLAANQFGWIAAEVGRQPWIVYGLLRTEDALSKTVTAAEVMTSMVLFTLIYGLLFVLWLHIMTKKILAGPEVHAVESES